MATERLYGLAGPITPTGTEALRNAATNLIVVETKKKYSTSGCAPQVIGYMGKPKYQRILDYSSRLDTNKKTPVLIHWARKKGTRARRVGLWYWDRWGRMEVLLHR